MRKWRQMAVHRLTTVILTAITVVEQCFGRLKEYRRIATRYDKTAKNDLAMVNARLHTAFLSTVM